jgi:uncharacterized protein (TIGR00251 family)
MRAVGGTSQSGGQEAPPAVRCPDAPRPVGVVRPGEATAPSQGNGQSDGSTSGSIPPGDDSSLGRTPLGPASRSRSPAPSSPAVGLSDSPAVSVGTEFERLSIHDHRGTIRIEVGVRPRSSRSAILGVREGALAVALRAAPAEGAANDELRALLAKSLEVRRGDVTIVLGASSRGKVVEVNGVTAEEARDRLARAKR